MKREDAVKMAKTPALQLNASAPLPIIRAAFNRLKRDLR